MLLRLLLLAALVMLAYKWLSGRWPWEKRRSTRELALANACNLLGLSTNANRNEIIAAHRRLVALVHPDRGGTSRQVHEANDARDLLLAALPDDDVGPGQESS